MPGDRRTSVTATMVWTIVLIVSIFSTVILAAIADRVSVSTNNVVLRKEVFSFGGYNQLESRRFLTFPIVS